VLTPKERRDSVVLVGVDMADRVDFVKVYALDEGSARRTLEEYFNARGLFPGDYRVISRGTEPVNGRAAITTRTEGELSATLGRFGLRLLSNGVLYVGDATELYQITLVSESLYRRLRAENAPEVNPFDLLSLGLNAVVENLRGEDLGGLVPEDAVVLYEPPLHEVLGLLRRGEGPIIVETKDASKYSSLDFSLFLRLPPLSAEEFAAEVSGLVGWEVPASLFREYPRERLNLWNARALASLLKKLVDEMGMSREDALRAALNFNLLTPQNKP